MTATHTTNIDATVALDRPGIRLAGSAGRSRADIEQRGTACLEGMDAILVPGGKGPAGVVLSPRNMYVTTVAARTATRTRTMITFTSENL